MASTSANRGYVGFTVNGAKLEFKAKLSIYDNLKTVLGLDHVEETSQSGDGYTTLSVREAVQSGKVIVLAVTGTAGKKTKSGRLVCPIDKATTAIPALTGKEYGGWTITKAYQSGDRRISY